MPSQSSSTSLHFSALRHSLGIQELEIFLRVVNLVKGRPEIASHNDWKIRGSSHMNQAIRYR